MKVLNFILLFLPILIHSQDNFLTVNDFNGLNQLYLDHVSYESEIYALGVTICNTGECGVLSKYDDHGELIFLKEIGEIDITSYRCLDINNDTLVLVALSKYEVGARLQMYDLQGHLLEDYLIKRDDALIYTWPLDIIYEDDCIYMAVNENYENESRQTAVYKIDYEGNVLDYIRLPYHYRGKILTLVQLANGNLFVTQPYIDEEDACSFEHVDIDNPNAVIFYEISSDSLEIVREKENICYQSSRSVSYDCTILSNTTIVRNVLSRDPIDKNIIHASNIYYNSDWEEIDIYKYPQLILGNPLASYGVIANRVYPSKNSNYFYVLSIDRYPVEDIDYPYGNIYIQKWDIDRNLIWERTISDPNVHHRLFLTSLLETDSAILLAGYVWSDFDVAGTQDFAVMSLDLDGCYNGDCSDIIYLNGPTAVHESDIDNAISVFPNPMLDVLNVKSASSLQHVAVYGMDGVLLRQEFISGYEYTMDIGDLISGMYVVRVVSDEGIRVQKMMKL